MEKFRDLADPQWERRINSFEETSLVANPATVAGIDPTGGTDSTAGLEVAIKEAQKLERALYVPAGKYKIGGSGKPLDFTKSWNNVSRVENFEMFCAAGARFEGSASLGTEPVVRIGPTAKGELVTSNLTFGYVESGVKTSSCVEVIGFSDGFLHFGYLKAKSESERAETSGLLLAPLNETENGYIIGNNEIHVGTMSTLGFGLRTLGQIGGIQVSGNQIFIAEIIKALHSGIQIDGNGTGHNTEWNTFYIGDIEFCGEYGVEEINGNNRYFIGSTNNNTSGTFHLFPGALAANGNGGTPYVRVSSKDTTCFKPEEQPIDGCNTITGELAWVPLELLNSKISPGKGIASSKKAVCAVHDGMVTISVTGEIITSEITAGTQLFVMPASMRPAKTRAHTFYQSAALEAGQGISILNTGSVVTKNKLAVGTIIAIEESFPIKALGE